MQDIHLLFNYYGINEDLWEEYYNKIVIFHREYTRFILALREGKRKESKKTPKKGKKPVRR